MQRIKAGGLFLHSINAAVRKARSVDSIRDELVNLRDLAAVAPAYQHISNKGYIDYDGALLIAQAARETRDKLVAQGMTIEQANAAPDPSTGAKIGSLVNLPLAFTQRVTDATDTSEGRAAGISVGNAASAALRLPSAKSLGDSIILYVSGESTLSDMVEEIVESDLVRALNSGRVTLPTLRDNLLSLQSELRAYDPDFKILPSKAPHDISFQNIVEAYSTLQHFDLLTRADRFALSPTSKAIIRYTLANTEVARNLRTAADAWATFANSEQGQTFLSTSGKSLSDLLDAAGIAQSKLFSDLRIEEADRIAADTAANFSLDTLAAEQQAALDTAAAAAEPAEEPATPEQSSSAFGITTTLLPPSSLRPHPALRSFEAGQPQNRNSKFNPNAKPILAIRMPDGSHLIVSGRTRHAIALADPSVKAVKTTLIDYNPDLHTDDWVRMTNAGEHITSRTATTEHFRTYFTLNPITHAQAIEQGLVPIDPATGAPSAAYTKGRQLAEQDLAAKAGQNSTQDTGSLSVRAKPTYTVVNDNVGLQEQLNDVVTPVEINFTPDKSTNWIKEAKRYISEHLAGKVFVLENTDGFSVKMPDSHVGKNTAVKGIRKHHQFKAEVVKKFEELFKRVVMLDTQSPAHKENESEARKNRVNAAVAFHKFGWPVRINGTEKMFWFGADSYKNAQEKELVFYEFGLQDINEKGDSAVRSIQPQAEAKQGTESPSSRETLGDYLANVKLNPNQDRVIPEIIKNSQQETSVASPEAAASFSFKPIKAPLVSDADAAKEALRKVQGKTFTNGEVTATVSGQTIGKTHAAHMSVRNLKALGYDDDEARKIHYSACAKIHEIFESAEYGFFEPNYDPENKKGRAGAWHYLGVVEVDGYGEFDVNVTAIQTTKESDANPIFTLELTIENPSGVSGDTLSQRGRALRSEGSSERRLAAYRSFVEKEIASIKKNAIENGTFMLAPNGKQSNLNERQWLHVRTAAFKKWFGDWENDPTNASKVVDENGEPLVVYHGTRSDFTVFDREKGGESNKYAYAGFWFSPIKGFGERFLLNTWWGDGVEREMALFLNLRNPKVFETRKNEPYGDAYEQFRTDVVSLLGKDAEFANIGGLGMAWHKGVNKMGIPDYMSTAEQKEVINEYRDKLKAEGYDGILIRRTEYDYSTAGSANDQYVAFEPNQIKSATDNRGTYSAASNDITLSLRRPIERNYAAILRERDATLLRVSNYIKRHAQRTLRVIGADTDKKRAGVAFAQANAIIAALDKYVFARELINRNTAEYRRLTSLRSLRPRHTAAGRVVRNIIDARWVISGALR